MKRSVFPRVAGLIFLYLGIFVILVAIQFTKQRGFTRLIGSMAVSGHYGEASVRTADAGGGVFTSVRPLEGGVTVSFGGMEFRLHGEGEFVFLRYDGERNSLLPQSMSVEGNSAVFGFRDGTRLTFSVLSVADSGGPELRITGEFGEGYAGLELPYRVLRTSRIRDAGNGQFVVMAEGMQYSFGPSQLDGNRRVLILDANDSTVYYRAVLERAADPERMEFESEDFMLLAAKDESLYNDAVNRWRDAAYSLWSGLARNTEDEALAIAYAGESVNRGAYQRAIADISPAFLRRASWSYNISMYLGRLDFGLRSLSAFERDAAARLSALIAAKSEDFFQESHVIEFCGVRGYGQLIDGAAELARSLDPESLSPNLFPGILEAYTEWNVYRSQADNPFESLVESACRAIYDGMGRNAAGDQVLYFRDGRADTEYNLRLGLALDRLPNREEWRILGRSLVVSVLALTENGSLPGELTISGAEAPDKDPEFPGVISAIPGSARVDCLTMYHLFPAGAYPRAVSIGVPANGTWAWTVSDSVMVSQENNLLDIAVSFPIGETHYMLIRGLRPFAKLQLYGIDYRTDPQFERYDSSGWSFSPSEQTLLLKLKHRSRVEHIRVFY
jgi:hypothetical protein